MGRLIIYCAGTGFDTLPAKNVKNILVNVFDNGMNDKAILNTQKMFAYAGTEIRFQDSGGFQILMAEEENKTMTFNPDLPLLRSAGRINISPSHVIETARRLQPQIITSLDFPVRKLTNKSDQQQEFLRKLGFNVEWTIETALLRQKYCPEVDLLIPIQAYDLDQFEFFKSLIYNITYDGFSMPLRNLQPAQIALFLLRFFQLGIRKVHLLGSTSFLNMAVAAYFACHFFQWVSLDSTSWRQAGEHGSYLNPNDLTAEPLTDDIRIDERIPMLCQCPFCKDRSFTFIKNLPRTDKTALLRSHNFWVTERVAEDLYANAGDLLSFEKFLKTRSPRSQEINELIGCLALIDTFKDGDIHLLKRFFKIAA
jgi:queuine/archaeosine tRNA-ribosyltransferase